MTKIYENLANDSELGTKRLADSCTLKIEKSLLPKIQYDNDVHIKQLIDVNICLKYIFNVKLNSRFILNFENFLFLDILKMTFIHQ